MKEDLYVLGGGIGKNICFTSCLSELNNITIMSSWPQVFTNHPNVNFAYDNDLYPWKDNTVFLNKFNNVHIIDAYSSFFFKNKIHLVNSFRNLLGLEMIDSLYSEIYFTDEEDKNMQPLLHQLQNFVMVQFIGGDESHLQTDFIGSRSLNKKQSQEIINILNFDLKLNVLNVFSFKDFFENTCKIDINLNYINYAYLIKHAKGFIGIDSSLNHMSSNKFCQTEGVVLWNDDNVKERFCYNKNINLTTNTPKTMRFDVNTVIDNFKKVMDKKQ